MTGNGGGSGGFVTIYVEETFGFRGKTVALSGPGAYPGCPGVVYQVSRDGITYYRKLIVEGTGMTIHDWDYEATWDRDESVEVEELSLPGNGHLMLKQVINTLM